MSDASIHHWVSHPASRLPAYAGQPGQYGLWRLLLVLSALMIFVASMVSAAERDAAETLSIGDKVTISVFGQTDLSGDFVLDGSGTVNMPLAGRIRVAGLTAMEAEARIRSALMDGYLKDAVVSLRVAELKPIYIMGEVRSPGTYPFRHGLNVLGAVALAGGYRVGDESLAVLKSELLLADERENLLNASLQTLMARRLRLEAERDGVKQLLPDPRTASAGAQLLAGEQEILDFQRRAREGERELLSQQVARLASERTALTEQGELAERQVELTKEQSSEYNKLAVSGHALRTVQVEREREHARARSDAARIRAELAKSETAKGELTLRLRELDTTYMRRVVLELQETRQKMFEVERSLPVAREIAESRRRRMIASEGSSAASDWDIRITRQAGLTPVTIQAKFETSLQPGDIVQVAPKARAIESRIPGGEAQTPMRSLTGLASQQ